MISSGGSSEPPTTSCAQPADGPKVGSPPSPAVASGGRCPRPAGPRSGLPAAFHRNSEEHAAAAQIIAVGLLEERAGCFGPHSAPKPSRPRLSAALAAIPRRQRSHRRDQSLSERSPNRSQESVHPQRVERRSDERRGAIPRGHLQRSGRPERVRALAATLTGISNHSQEAAHTALTEASTHKRPRTRRAGDRPHALRSAGPRKLRARSAA